MLMCKGFKQKQLNQLKLIRMQSWVNFCGYADPKKAPKSPEEWWPLEEQSKPKGRPLHKDKKRLEELHKRFSNLKRG